MARFQKKDRYPNRDELIEVVAPVVYGMWAGGPGPTLGGVHYALVWPAGVTARHRAARAVPGWWLFLGLPEGHRGEQNVIFRRAQFIASGSGGWIARGPDAPSRGGFEVVGEYDPFSGSRSLLPSRINGVMPDEDSLMLFEVHMLPRALELLKELELAPRGNPRRRRAR